jgi:AmmeMemoRadiSam system protein B
MQAIRSPAVAGSFYPANSQELSQVVDRLLDDAASDDPAPKVIVAPHAGFVYSGPIAASVYQRLRNRRHDISRVVLLGPSHRVGFRGIAATSASAYETPLGKIPIAAEAVSCSGPWASLILFPWSSGTPTGRSLPACLTHSGAARRR